MNNDRSSGSSNADGTPQHMLPEDVSLWPTPPAEILGITDSATRKEAKRAYTRLIKRFKPEHFPEQFRRLREAYDQVDSRLQWQEKLASHGFTIQFADDSSATITPTENTSEGSGSPAAESSEPPLDATDPELSSAAQPSKANPNAVGETGGRNSPQVDSADQHWQRVLDGGDTVVVYRALERLAASGDATETDFLRLYWLATLQSDIDPERVAVSWLIEGMQQHGPEGRLLGLYASELERHPSEIRHERSIALLDLMSRRGRLVDLMRIRWRAARDLGQFEIIESDLESFRQRLFDDFDGWCTLLLGVMHQTAMTSTVTAIEMFRTAEEELRTLLCSNPSHWLWDSFDALNEQQLAWHQIESMADGESSPLRGLIQLIEQTWNCNHNEAQSALRQYCQHAMESSYRGLDHWNLLENSCRPLLRKFVELLIEHREIERKSSDDLSEASRSNLKRWIREIALQFQELRQTGLLDYCITESFTTDDVANAMDEMLDELPANAAEVAERVRGDLALRTAIEAHRLFE